MTDSRGWKKRDSFRIKGTNKDATGRQRRKNRKSQPILTSVFSTSDPRTRKDAVDKLYVKAHKDCKLPCSSSCPRNDFYKWTEGQWLAAEHKQQKNEDEILPTCKNCGTKPSEDNGFEEKFCKCGMVHAVTKRKQDVRNQRGFGVRNENEAAKSFKKSNICSKNLT